VTNVTFIFEASPHTKRKEKMFFEREKNIPAVWKSGGTRTPYPPPNCGHVCDMWPVSYCLYYDHVVGFTTLSVQLHILYMQETVLQTVFIQTLYLKLNTQLFCTCLIWALLIERWCPATYSIISVYNE